jgi:hypothetical protein
MYSKQTWSGLLGLQLSYSWKVGLSRLLDDGTSMGKMDVKSKARQLGTVHLSSVAEQPAGDTAPGDTCTGTCPLSCHTVRNATFSHTRLKPGAA